MSSSFPLLETHPLPRPASPARAAIGLERWRERTRQAGAKLFSDGLAVENGPTDEDLKACEALGKSFAEACGK